MEIYTFYEMDYINNLIFLMIILHRNGKFSQKLSFIFICRHAVNLK